MKALLLTLCAAAAVASFNGQAAEVPKATTEDARIRTIRYQQNDVTVVRVRRGTVTRVVLAPDEAINVAVTGFSARCGNEGDEWCIVADKGSNQIFVRPKDSATKNNLELRTNQRDYSIEFVVLPDDTGRRSKSGEAEPFYRVMFEYPKPPQPLRSAVASLLTSTEARPVLPLGGGMSPQERLKQEAPAVRNSNYSMQVMEKGEDAAPSLVFDDGRFTYFEFLGARQLPSIEAYGSDEQPSRVNWHMEPPYIVVERLARKFTLRIGSSVTGVFNESFDPIGTASDSGTTSSAVKRDFKEKQ